MRLVSILVLAAACRTERPAPPPAPAATTPPGAPRAAAPPRPSLPARDAAFAQVLASKNAMRDAPSVPPPGNAPVPLPPRERALVDAIDRYVEITTPDDPELAHLKFLAATALARWHQPEALGRLAAVMRDHPGDEVAEYAANIMLDMLNRGGDLDEMHAWVDKLLADPAFLAGRDDLRATLEQLAARFASSAD